MSNLQPHVKHICSTSYDRIYEMASEQVLRGLQSKISTISDLQIFYAKNYKQNRILLSKLR